MADSKVTDEMRKTGNDLPEQKVTTDKETGFSSDQKDGEIFMETREADANIERARKLAEENTKIDQKQNK